MTDGRIYSTPCTTHTHTHHFLFPFSPSLFSRPFHFVVCTSCGGIVVEPKRFQFMFFHDINVRTNVVRMVMCDVKFYNLVLPFVTHTNATQQWKKRENCATWRMKMRNGLLFAAAAAVLLATSSMNNNNNNNYHINSSSSSSRNGDFSFYFVSSLLLMLLLLPFRVYSVVSRTIRCNKFLCARAGNIIIVIVIMCVCLKRVTQRVCNRFIWRPASSIASPISGPSLSLFLSRPHTYFLTLYNIIKIIICWLCTIHSNTLPKAFYYYRLCVLVLSVCMSLHCMCRRLE